MSGHSPTIICSAPHYSFTDIYCSFHCLSVSALDFAFLVIFIFLSSQDCLFLASLRSNSTSYRQNIETHCLPRPTYTSHNITFPSQSESRNIPNILLQMEAEMNYQNCKSDGKKCNLSLTVGQKFYEGFVSFLLTHYRPHHNLSLLQNFTSNLLWQISMFILSSDPLNSPLDSQLIRFISFSSKKYSLFDVWSVSSEKEYCSFLVLAVWNVMDVDDLLISNPFIGINLREKYFSDERQAERME